MINQVEYDINTTKGPVQITITPVNRPLSDGNFYATGVYRLSDGVVGMGDIVFDEDMKDWNYNGMDELTYEEAAEVARFIQNYKDPEGADPNEL
jgi:hypothetical protein